MSSNSVTRRYTPPTCTLEIAAKDSPLSRWMGQSVLKHLRFKLSFDDPRVGEDQWTTIRGDRNQLQALCDAVSHYVQNFLSQSSRIGNGNAATITEPMTDFIPQAEQNLAGIHITPKGLISHELHLGSLANESTGPSLQLSAVQLADLASALDEYAADVTALPNLEKPRWLQSTPGWGTIAAGAIAAIGIGVPLTLKMIEPTPIPQTAQAPSSDDQRLPIQPLPSGTPGSNTIGSLPTTPLPLPSGSPSGTATTPPNLNPSNLPNQAGQPPQQIRIAQEPPVEAPPQQQEQQIQVEGGNPPLRDVPVESIPNQANQAQAKKPENSGNTGADARSRNPNEAPEPPASTADASIASTPNGASPSAAIAPQPAPLSRRTATPAAVSIPQVDEAKTFFQGTWKPQQGLTSAIQYNLTLSPDGSLKYIEPVEQEAGRFLDKTGIPVTGTRLVSPLKGGEAVIRLVLLPDGTVRTFLLK